MARHRITYITAENALPSTKQFSSERAAGYTWADIVANRGGRGPWVCYALWIEEVSGGTIIKGEFAANVTDLARKEGVI